MSEEEFGAPPMDGGAITASALAPQLGTDQFQLAQGEYDMRRLSVLEKKQMRFVFYAALRAKKSKAWANILDTLLNYSISIGGRGRRDIIRMEQVSHGMPVSVESEITRPQSWLERNVTNRNWREQQLRELNEQM